MSERQQLAAPRVRPRPPAPTAAAPNPTAAIGVRFAAAAVSALITAGASGVLLLWWRGTDFAVGPGEWLSNLGRATGLLAGYAVAVLLALMARIPALEHGVGTDRLARWHASGGRWTVCLVVAHTVLIIWGYAVTAHTDVVHQTTTMILSYPDILMATVALFLFVCVGISSARAARRRMSYETWHFVHLYTYLAVALAFSHQFANGAQFIDDSLARWLWSLLYAAVAALLVWYRLVTPLAGAARHRMRVAAVRREGPDVVSVYVTGRRLDELATAPGQFFRWRFLTRHLWWAANPYSLSAPPDGELLRITVKVTGDHSAALQHLSPGTRVVAEGPYGSFTAARRRRPKVLLVAGGVGISPLRALFETLPGEPGEVTLVYRASRPEDLVLRDELDAIAQRRGARVHYLLGPSRIGAAHQLSAGNLRRLVPDLRDRDVFLCGPPGMTALVRSSLRRAGVANRHIHDESFTF